MIYYNKTSKILVKVIGVEGKYTVVKMASGSTFHVETKYLKTSPEWQKRKG